MALLPEMLYSASILQWESKKFPLSFSDIFPKRLGIFSPNFTCLLYVSIYAPLQISIQLQVFATLTKLCHIKRNHPVHTVTPCSKCSPSAETRWHYSQTGIFSSSFTRLLYIHIYARLQFFIQYVQLWRRYAILTATTQRAFRPMVDFDHMIRYNNTQPSYVKLGLKTTTWLHVWQESPADARVTRDSAIIPRWPSAAILDIIKPQIAPFDPPTPRSLASDMEWIRCTVCEIFAFKLHCDLETGVRVTQGHQKWHYSIEHIRLYIRLP